MKQQMKILLILIFSLTLSISCTSSKEEDGEVMSDAEMIDEGGETLDNLDAELDGELAQGLETDGEFATDDEFALDEGGDEFGGDEFADDEFADDDFGGDEFAEGDDFFSEEGTESEFAESDEFGGSDEFAETENVDEFASEPLQDDTSEDVFADTGDAFGDTTDSGFADTTGDTFGSSDAGFSEVESMDGEGAFAGGAGGFEEVDSESTRDWVPVKKMATTPFQKGGQLLNTIYIVRPGDTIESVSQKIYGADRVQDLYAANPHLHRSFTTGDKMYYNSPNRPNDSNQIITYYEDVGIPAQSYITQEGDNIRAVANQVMGFPDAWKEMWAINMNVESKGQVPAGLELRYFPEGVSAPSPSQTIAQNEPMEEPMDQGMPPEDQNQQAMNDIPPPPPPPGQEMERSDMAAAGSVEPPPPPPPVEPPPPPPPPPENVGQQAKVDKKGGGIFSNMKLILAAILLIGGGLAIIIIQKNKSKKINIGETQV